MSEASCPSCGKPRGTNVDCLSCRDFSAKGLAKEARDITDERRVSARAEAAGRFLERPPWWAKLAPKKLLHRVRLLWMLLGDYLSGRYRKIPWTAIVTCAAALAYVISPFDLIPDFLVPIGWTDDMVVMMLAWRSVKKELLAYCEWKGISPKEFGLIGV